ncbi:MAG: Uma2 family endonuclease [Planctomycetes bacterium]|nr:Uma2 family endonuclease [Planctomycetota bacterium]
MGLGKCLTVKREEARLRDEPVLIAEVLSRSTRRLDEGEKNDAYLTIPSLSVYMLIEQEMPAVVVYRLVMGSFVREDSAASELKIRVAALAKVRETCVLANATTRKISCDVALVTRIDKNDFSRR